MDVRVYEIRDRGTTIPAMAIRLNPRDEFEFRALWRTGYGNSRENIREYVLLFRLAGGSNVVNCDPYEWCDRTMATAHRHITEEWPESGAVVDVEYILGETSHPKQREIARTP